VIDPIKFEIINRINTGLGRSGILHTPHGKIETPAFLPVGTKATLKGIGSDKFSNLGLQGLLSNTYHLFLQPGSKIVAEHGGLHNFMNFDGPIMTDSGGFQVFSLGAAFGKGVTKFAKGDVNNSDQRTGLNVYAREQAAQHGQLCIVDNEGVTFTSHIDGSLHRFSAERSVEIQHELGADIIVAFDECTSPTAKYDYQLEALERTHNWADRSLKAHLQNVKASQKQGLYGVIQGGRFADLRQKSASYFAAKGFAGYGIGGSFSKEDLGESLRVVNEILPDNKPRHLLGIGEPEDIFAAVEQGIDTFDCVAPTRLGRVGTLYTDQGKMDFTKSWAKGSTDPMSKHNNWFKNTTYTAGYIHHLFKAREILGSMLLSEANVYFLLKLTKNIRDSINNNIYKDFRDGFLNKYTS
jgi:queuine tRNA-ribosyltransferase